MTGCRHVSSQGMHGTPLVLPQSTSRDPCCRNFVVGEKSQHGPPNAYIYQYPSLTLEQTLEHGTEQAYSAAAFNQAGDRLATVGSFPDFMLTVWDWRSGCTLLRSKAFSQEVYCVSFCPYADGSLVTSGLISVVLGCRAMHVCPHRHAAHVNSTCNQW